jgi:hypothetical protein
MQASPHRPKIDPQEALKWLAALRRGVGRPEGADFIGHKKSAGAMPGLRR